MNFQEAFKVGRKGDKKKDISPKGSKLTYLHVYDVYAVYCFT